MPCSGLNSATSSTPDAPASRPIVVAPFIARPVRFVSRPTRWPESGRKPSSRSTSTPVHTAAAPAGAGGSTTAEATTVATRPRSAVTLPPPEGCTRLDRKMTKVSDAGSSQSEVPVKPVWP